MSTLQLSLAQARMRRAHGRGIRVHQSSHSVLSRLVRVATQPTRTPPLPRLLVRRGRRSSLQARHQSPTSPIRARRPHAANFDRTHRRWRCRLPWLRRRMPNAWPARWHTRAAVARLARASRRIGVQAHQRVASVRKDFRSGRCEVHIQSARIQHQDRL